MELSEEQINEVKVWVRAGVSLSDIQNRMRTDFEVSMTYMDVRFLVDDLGVVPDVVEEPVEASSEDDAESTDDADEAATEVEDAEIVGDGSGVSVEVDAVKRPGALVSGTVQFSDGKQMSWQLDAAGQLGLVPSDDPDYRPSPEDVQAFQTELAQVLQSQGY